MNSRIGSRQSRSGFCSGLEERPHPHIEGCCLRHRLYTRSETQRGISSDLEGSMPGRSNRSRMVPRRRVVGRRLKRRKQFTYVSVFRPFVCCRHPSMPRRVGVDMLLQHGLVYRPLKSEIPRGSSMVGSDVEKRLWAAADQLWANTGLCRASSPRRSWVWFFSDTLRRDLQRLSSASAPSARATAARSARPTTTPKGSSSCGLRRGSATCSASPRATTSARPSTKR